MKRRSIAGLGIAIAIVATLALCFRSLLFQHNFHTVIAHDIYRSAQPSPELLAHWIQSLGLRSLINLKRGNPGDHAADATTRTATAAGLDLHYVRLSARRWPSPQEVEQLIAILDTAPRPVLIHCHGGTDRSGLAAAIALLLAGYGPDRAHRQFALEYGYLGEFLGSNLPGFLSSYAGWLEHARVPHTAERFRSWVRTDYVADYYEADLEFSPLSGALRAGDPFRLKIRVTNRSPQPIPMRCNEGEGVRLSLRLRFLSQEGTRHSERRFCRRAEALAPSASVIVETDEYRLASPGTYEFSADLVDENREHFFADMGSQIVRQAITVE